VRASLLGLVVSLIAAVTSACRSDANREAQPVTLVVAQSGDPGALNPAVTTSGNTHPVTDQIFNGLLGLDEQFNPIPELAERWSVEDGGSTYRFFLRRDVRWHDGQPFTSKDVEFTFEQALLRYHSRTRAALEGLLSSIETPDDHTAVFRLNHPYSPLLQRLDVVEASIIPKHLYEGQDLLAGEPTRRPVGTGPFRFVSYAAGDRLILDKNPDYFRRGFPRVDRVVFRIFPNSATAVAGLEAGQVDYVSSVPGPDLERLRGNQSIAIVQSTGGSGGSICQDVLIPNVRLQPFSDVRVRRAFAHAIDRQFIVDRVYFKQGRPATGPISHLLTWAYTPDVTKYPHDTERARALLDEAGFKSNAGDPALTITFTHANNHARLGQALREQLKAVGIDLKLQVMDFNAAVEQVFVKKTFELGLASYCNGADPDIGVRRVYVSSNIGPFPFSNGAGYRNPRVDALFDLAARDPNRDERRTHYVEIQKILADDVPYFWLIDSEGYRAHRREFTGFRLWTGAFLESAGPVSHR
jgi:peptide/nickel transport system substrate-binding protein